MYIEEMETTQEDARRIQHLIARAAPLDSILETICELVENQTPGAWCSILIFDQTTETLSYQAGRSMPPAYRAVAQDLPIGPTSTLSGAAAFARQMVVSEDILADPDCEPYWDLAEQLNIRSGAAFPVISTDRQLLAICTLYHPHVGPVTPAQQEPIGRATALVALAIERHRDRHALTESEQRYRSLFSQNPDAVFSLDRNGYLRSVNKSACDSLGMSEQELLGMHYRDLVSSDNRGISDRAFGRLMGGNAFRYEVTLNDASGDGRMFDLTNVPIVVEERVVGSFGIATDITERKRKDQKLQLLERSVASVSNGVVITDATQPDMPIVFANAAFLEMTGYTEEEVIGRNCRFLQGPETDKRPTRRLREAIADDRDARATLVNYRKDGSWFWNDLYISPVPDGNGPTTHYVGVQHDVTTHKAYEASLAHQANYEPVTGLLNRTQFEARVARACEVAHDQNTAVAVFFIDLDEFKPVNEALGRSVGDELLRTIARRLSSLIAPGDTLASFGGDEFVVLAYRRNHASGLDAVAEKLLRRLDQSCRIDTHDLHLTASIGVATNDNTVDHPDDLIRHADMAMRVAKRSGRNTYHWYSPEINDETNERVHLRHALHDAIRNEQFELYYQPLVYSGDGQVSGFEALIRWHHPEKGLVSPGTFIPLAESTGQIIAIGDWVLRRACEDLAKLNREATQSYTMAVNISPIQFHARNFLDNLFDVVRSTNIQARWLVIELTEGVFLERPDAAIDILSALRNMGIQVAIDDFGTGFSSLSYLKYLPLDKVKIDRSFIRDIRSDSRDAAIVQGMLSMMSHLSYTTVAEGVETAAQRDALVEYGCDLLQGFLFAKPMPLSDVYAYLEKAHYCRRVG